MFHSAEFLTRADTLWKSGVIFVEGVSDSKNGQKLIAAIYDGQVIAQGTKIEVMQELKIARESETSAMKYSLSELAAINRAIATGTGGFINYLKVISTNMIGQLEPLSCAVACLRQLAKDKNILLSEDAIRKMGGMSKEFATYEKEMTEASKKIFKNKSFGEGILGENDISTLDLMEVLSQNGSWIAWVKNSPNSEIYHSIVIDKVENGLVYIRDPWPLNGLSGIKNKESGVEACLKFSEFERMWNLSNKYAFWFRN